MSGSAHHPMWSALSWAAAAWARGGQTGRLRHQGTGRDQRKNPSANLSLWLLWLSACKLGPAAYSRLWAQYWESLQHSGPDIAGPWASLLVWAGYWIWSAASQLSQLTSELSRVFITDLILQRLVVVLVKCRTVVSNSNNNNSTCWPSGVQRQSSDWWVHTLCIKLHSVETAAKSSQNAANICQNCASRGKKTCNVCQRIVPWRIVYMFWVLQLGQVDFIYFMFINCLIPKMLETIRARLNKLLIV